MPILYNLGIIILSSAIGFLVSGLNGAIVLGGLLTIVLTAE